MDKGKWTKWGAVWYDFQQIWAHKPMRLALMGVLLLPLVYSCIYLKAFFDPYENMKYLPVAVVNEDKGAVQDGEPIHVGDDLVRELHEDSKLKWEFVSRTQMHKGFKEGKYYVGIVIPGDFSRKAVSVDSPAPLKGELQYYVDESNNYLSGRLGESIIRELENQLEEKLTHVYVDKIFEKMKQSARDLAQAADGAEELANGTSEAAKGNQKVKSGVDQLQDGTARLKAGAERLSNYLTRMNEELVKAKKQTEEPLKLLLKIKPHLHHINQTLQKMDDGQTALPPKNGDSMLTRVESIEQSLRESQSTNDQLVQLLQKLFQNHPELAEDPRAHQLASALSNNREQHRRIADQLDQLESDAENITVNESLPELKELAAYSQKIEADVDRAIYSMKKMDQLIRGTSEMANGAQQLAKGQHDVIQGLNKLEDGVVKLQKGLEKIQDGQSELADGLRDGVEDANKSLANSGQKADTITDPVLVKHNNLHPVPNYATGFAPYFISLSLWVGAMMLFTVIDLYQVLDQKPGREPLTLTAGAIIGAAQAVICTSAIIGGLGIQPELPGWMYLFTIVMSFTFIAINQMLIALLKNPGRFVAIILLMLQLTSSAGTYPLPLLPEFFRELHPYLPMTYTVHGLRAVLSSGDFAAMLKDICILLGFMSGAYVVTQIHLRWLKPWMGKVSLLAWQKKTAA